MSATAPDPTAATSTPLPGPEHADRVLALLAAGAAGDALGGVVEFTPASGIAAVHGPAGVTDAADLLAQEGAHALPITDDTQLTLYVLDGLLEWIEWQNDGVLADPAACVWLACLRWFATQDGALPEGAPPAPPRWIDAHAELKVRRAPGTACLSGLAEPGMGLPGDPHNPGSKGCGTVMRSAPYGMVPGLEDPHVVSLARQGAVLTHGHPTAWVAAAAYALVIAALLRGLDLAAAVLARYFGVLLTSLGLVTGMLLGALVLDVVVPTPASVVTPVTVTGTLATLAGLVVVTLPWRGLPGVRAP